MRPAEHCRRKPIKDHDPVQHDAYVQHGPIADDGTDQAYAYANHFDNPVAEHRDVCPGFQSRNFNALALQEVPDSLNR